MASAVLPSSEKQAAVLGPDSGLEKNNPKEKLIAEKCAMLSAMLSTIMHQLSLSKNGPQNIRKEEVESLLAQAEYIYKELTDLIRESAPEIADQLPLYAMEFANKPEYAGLLEEGINTCAIGIAPIAHEMTNHFIHLIEYENLLNGAEKTPSIFDKSLGKASIELMGKFDARHEKMISENIEKTRTRNKQLAMIQNQLSFMYEQRASGKPINREAFEEKYNQARDLLAELCKDFEDLSEYVDFPELEEGFEPSEEGIRSFCQKLELMKIRPQGSISDLSSDMQMFLQTYTIIIDIMKNMLEMDRNEREAIVGRTGP